VLLLSGIFCRLNDYLDLTRCTHHSVLCMTEQPGILGAHLLACAYDLLCHCLGRQPERGGLRHGAERGVLFPDAHPDAGKDTAVIGLRLLLGGEPFERAAEQRHLAPECLERLCRG
jgi:hypothetical protein